MAEIKKNIIHKSLIIALITTIILFIQIILYISPSYDSQNYISSTTFIYYIAASFAQSAILVALAWLITYLPFQYFSSTRKISLFVFSTACILLNIFIYVDRTVFNIYKFHINSFVLKMLFGEGAGQIFIVTQEMVIKITFLISLIVAVFVLLVYLAIKYISFITMKELKSIMGISFIALILTNVFHAYADASARYPAIQLVSEKIPYFYPLTAKSLMMKLGVVNIYDRERGTDSSLEGIINYPKKDIEIEDNFKNKNVVYIVVDAWNPRVFTEEVMPNTHNFAKRCSVFNNHLSSASLTQGGIFGLFFGLSPNYWKLADMSASRPVLLDQLQKKNYDIKLFPSATLVNPPFHRVVFGGIDNLNIETVGETPYDRDIQLTKNFISYLDEREEKAETSRFFSFLFYDLLHASNIPAEHRTKFTPSWDYPDYMSLSNETDPEQFLNLYKNCGIYLDSLIGEVLNNLEKRGLLEETIIVITGDHSEEFNENKKNYWGHGSNFSKAQIGVPMMYYNSDREATVNNHRTSHYDISPTVLKEAIGVVNPPEDYSMGQYIYDNKRDSIHIVMSANRLAFVTDNLIFERKWGYFNVTDSHLNPKPDFIINPEFIKRALEIENAFMK